MPEAVLDAESGDAESGRLSWPLAVLVIGALAAGAWMGVGHLAISIIDWLE
jgi:hypothetical protein